MLVFEHKLLYAERGEVPDGDGLVELGRAEVVRSGSDVTVVATQLMRHRALEAAEVLAREGVEVELIDPRTLVPLDLATIVASVEKTGRLACVQECVAGRQLGRDDRRAGRRTGLGIARRAARSRQRRRDADPVFRVARGRLDAGRGANRSRRAKAHRGMSPVSIVALSI